MGRTSGRIQDSPPVTLHGYSRFRAGQALFWVVEPGCLLAVHVGVDPLARHEFLMRSLFRYFAAINHIDSVGHADGREPMADQQGGMPGNQFPELCVKMIFGVNIKRTGRLVEDDELRLT